MCILTLSQFSLAWWKFALLIILPKNEICFAVRIFIVSKHNIIQFAVLLVFLTVMFCLHCFILFFAVLVCMWTRGMENIKLWWTVLYNNYIIVCTLCCIYCNFCHAFFRITAQLIFARSCTAINGCFKSIVMYTVNHLKTYK